MKVYHITIKEVDTYETETKEWRKVHDKEVFDNEVEPQYAYVESNENMEIEKKIYEQTVDEINIVKIIDAINK